ncbi:hypothetical protein LMG31884_47260 (plasmid) [Xanthomonas hydrangeae]|uniref:hypothetical protein n=1 Tax=Xanthomonas hydrangeae TaxID=2775159 RepID=UPI0019652B42|nr:hypothetical protein LMG31884_47260 [Xanthomonas hydrangeae]CAD7741087.1 hypothetical protein LMG31884_47260 [Xanthomonas hydrangeae]CAD7747968.1 hypothetical protein LMG31887_46550 [Xanthomonas hydrangeae]CAD7747969.1 hypothetical protein LMG31887_46550 [Xanthomonas hydrangeae]CAD7748154.1 hypothetical protein LMG31885_44940 [Xanthomonas hydrangeae]
MHQTVMKGPDWLSKLDVKKQARAEAARKKAAQKCAKALSAAADALHEFSRACCACDDASAVTRGDDSRTILAASNREYSGWLEDKYGN